MLIKGVDQVRDNNDYEYYYTYVNDYEQDGLRYFMHGYFIYPLIVNGYKNAYLRRKQLSDLNSKLMLRIIA